MEGFCCCVLFSLLFELLVWGTFLTVWGPYLKKIHLNIPSEVYAFLFLLPFPSLLCISDPPSSPARNSRGNAKTRTLYCLEKNVLK